MAIVTFNIFSSAASCSWIEMLEPRKKKKKKVKTIYLFKNGVVWHIGKMMSHLKW